MRRVSLVFSFLFMISFKQYLLVAQISPGDLSNAHSNLEGISNCTQCHILGNKVSSEKCLACHTEIKERIAAKKGYHASSDVDGGECALCHSEHNGKNFRLINLDVNNFNHDLTGYKLSVPHSKKTCNDCHTASHISDPKLKARKKTYLGVGQECLTCHADYHLRTLSQNCSSCHDADRFKPASKFTHDNARFRLIGKHTTVDCAKCHKISMTDGKKFQQFTGLQYSNCTSCHKDPHNNQFGQNCRKCHSEESFQSVQNMAGFDHDKTGYKLEDKHLIVNCKSCHKNKLTDPLKHDLCRDCHADYHNGQFSQNGKTPDCSSCHSLKGFTSFSYTVEQHNTGIFPLKGSHDATPCYECHRKQEKWSFRQIGTKCADCHADIHKTFIDKKYYPDSECRNCHNENSWSSINFDHSVTGFALDGSHKMTSCRNCHFRSDDKSVSSQKFSGLSQQCSACHTDKHYRQFEKNGVTSCTECHSTDNWKASRFDHSKTAFSLDGKHATVPCFKCHKPEQEGNISFIRYKIKDFRCESCHL